MRNQKYENLEHVVQDGVSAEGTLQSVAAISDNRLQLVSEPNAGIYEAINRGKARATGDVTGLVHSDDLLASSEILAVVAGAVVDPGVDAVYGDLDYVAASDTTRVVRRWRSQFFEPPLLWKGWMPPNSRLFVRREVFERYGAYDPSFWIAADYDAVLGWFSQPGFRAVQVPEVFVKIRMGGASNASLRHLLRKSTEDHRSLKNNRVGVIGTVARKNFLKLP